MKLKEFFKVSKMTRKEFAQRLGVHPITVSRYENNIMEPSSSMAKRIIEVSGKMITLEDLTEYWEKKNG